MSLATYSDLQTAISGEFRRSEDSVFVAAIPDLIARAEARLNRVLRLREQEQTATSTYDSTFTSRRVSLPDGFVEMLSLKIKEASEADTEYCQMEYIAPERFYKFVETSLNRPQRFTLTDQIEMDTTTTGTYTLWMHYIKRWDIATDTSNWLLTNHPDIYLYACFIQAALYLRGDHLTQIPTYKTMLESDLTQLNRVDQRSRNDSKLSTYEFTSGSDLSGSYRILSDNY